MTQQSFIEQLRARIRDVRRESEEWSRKEEEVARRRKELQEELQQLIAAETVYRRITGEQPAVAQGSTIPMEAAEFGGYSVPDAILKLLKERGGRVKTSDLVDVLQRAGKLAANRHIAYSHTFATLKRLKGRGRVTQNSAGEWSLVTPAT